MTVKRTQPIERHGASLIETSMVLMILFVILFGIFEFGMTALRQNMLDETAHRLARAAALRGEDSHMDTWGPTSIETTLDQSPELLAEIGPATYLFDPSRIQVVMTWQNDMATTNSELTVMLSCDQPLLLGNLWGMNSIPLSSQAVERVE